jgi:hypothetical protein
MSKNRVMLKLMNFSENQLNLDSLELHFEQPGSDCTTFPTNFSHFSLERAGCSACR